MGNTATDRARRMAGVAASGAQRHAAIKSATPRAPCVEHPNWEADECVWCRREGTGYFGGANYRLSVEAKAKLHLQTGEHFEDHAQYRAWCRATGHRDIEKGEKSDESWRIFSEWTKGGQKGKNPLPPTLSGGRPEMTEKLSDMMERMTASGELAQRIERMGLKGRDTVRLGPADPRLHRDM